MTPMVSDVNSMEISGFTYTTSSRLTNNNLIIPNGYVNNPNNVSTKDLVLEFTVGSTKKKILFKMQQIYSTQFSVQRPKLVSKYKRRAPKKFAFLPVSKTKLYFSTSYVYCSFMFLRKDTDRKMNNIECYTTH